MEVIQKNKLQLNLKILGLNNLSLFQKKKKASFVNFYSDFVVKKSNLVLKKNTTKLVFYFLWFFFFFNLNTILTNFKYSCYSKSSTLLNFLKSPNRFKMARNQLKFSNKILYVRLTFFTFLSSCNFFNYFLNKSAIFFFESNFCYIVNSEVILTKHQFIDFFITT